MERVEVDRGVHLYRRSASGPWWLDVVQQSGRIQKSLRTIDKHKALAVARELAASIVAGTWNVAAAARMTIETACVEYRESLVKRGRAAGTLERFSDFTKRFLPWSQQRGIGTLDDLRVEQVEDYLAERRKAVAPATLLGEFARLKALLSWAEKRGFVRRNVARLTDAPRITRSVKLTLTPKQIGELLDATQSPDARDAVVVIANTGVRLGELLSIRAGDLDETGPTLLVRSQKTYSERVVGLNEAAMMVLARRKLASGGGVLFTIGHDGLRQAIRRAGERIGIPHIGPHALRRSWATALARVVPQLALQRAGGWSSPAVVAGYYVAADVSRFVPPVVVRAK